MRPVPRLFLLLLLVFIFDFIFILLVSEFDGLDDAVGVALDDLPGPVDLLAGLLDGAEDGLVLEVGAGDDAGLLVLERDVVALNACKRDISLVIEGNMG